MSMLQIDQVSKLYRASTFGGTGSSNDIYLDRLLQRANVGLQEVEIISMSFPEINTAMANRAIDVGWQSEPGIALGIEQGLFEPFSCIGELVPGYQSTYMFFSQQFAANRSAAEPIAAPNRGGT